MCPFVIIVRAVITTNDMEPLIALELFQNVAVELMQLSSGAEQLKLWRSINVRSQTQRNVINALF